MAVKSQGVSIHLKWNASFNYMGPAKRKGAVFEHVPKMHIFRFIVRMRKVSSGHLLATDTFYDVQWFC